MANRPDPRYPETPLADLDLSKVATYPLSGRQSKVSLDQAASPWRKGGTVPDLLDSLPDILAAADLKTVAARIAGARRRGRGVLLGMGAHPIKVGLGPIIAGAIDDGIFTGLATNGAAIVHDYEMALTGGTSEDVDAALDDGGFGMAEETATALNRAVSEGAADGSGIGAAVGLLIHDGGLPYAEASIFAAAHRARVPATVHVAIGTDIIHMHPSCDGAALGAAGLADFHLFTRQVAALEEGVYINLGSAVILPEVFLKACSLAHNLGHSLDNLVTVNMDFIQHYRPRVNVVHRPTTATGEGFALTGHHEIMLPLLLAAVREQS